MEHRPIASGKRKPVNLSLDTGIVEAAREAGLNLSQISEAGIAAAIKQERERRWREETRAQAAGWAKWVEENGLPLDRYRLF
ncbi:type II toxin-antitoxin system CcdA family antitoxin [Sphingomonas donggukensis]|uniref:Type II toxin-antitoxin system CcdA family antitoxin n=1 Tax=Sphingomonas donggukensis TaxID=2949093 RepID=A0ABY4TTL1_9SPHN|nr:type II toxin-antitoxin system CcdA family antitoxin [Sphingomonas donggukensis]URW75740.1 type II toxin-antitoxin system CcdA family antitoxin [Sphingomonas donggukensis]